MVALGMTSSFRLDGLLGDFFEVAETEGLDHLGLHGRDVLVGLVGAKGRADDGADSAACSSTDSQSPPKCQAPSAIGVTSCRLAPGVPVCIRSSMAVGVPYTWAASRPAW